MGIIYRLARMNDILFPDYVNSDNFPIVGGISTLQMINTSSLLIILEYFIGYDFITRWSIIGAGLSFLIFNYFCLQWKGKDKIIYEMFKNKAKTINDFINANISNANEAQRMLIYTFSNQYDFDKTCYFEKETKVYR